jgi:hypothetical protein
VSHDATCQCITCSALRAREGKRIVDAAIESASRPRWFDALTRIPDEEHVQLNTPRFTGRVLYQGVNVAELIEAARLLVDSRYLCQGDDIIRNLDPEFEHLRRVLLGVPK